MKLEFGLNRTVDVSATFFNYQLTIRVNTLYQHMLCNYTD